MPHARSNHLNVIVAQLIARKCHGKDVRMKVTVEAGLTLQVIVEAKRRGDRSIDRFAALPPPVCFH
jgi:hypothetical protein